MKVTKEKIIKTAIDLFNQHGVGNVRIKDIAEAAKISPGNLTYHFPTKTDLISGVYSSMRQSLENMTLGHQMLTEGTNWLQITTKYLQFQIDFRFFFRDALEIIHLFPEVKNHYRAQIQSIINFNKNGLFLAVGKGYMKPEPHDGHYEILAKNIWAILNSWLTEREILEHETTDIADGIRAILELHYPYLTEKGIKFYYTSIESLSDLIPLDLND